MSDAISAIRCIRMAAWIRPFTMSSERLINTSSKLEPYLDQAAPVTEAAVLMSGRALETPCTEINFGWVKLLSESRVQFDLIDQTAEWERYAMVILPDELALDAKTASRLNAFVTGGGALIVTHKGGLVNGKDSTWLERYGLHYAGNV